MSMAGDQALYGTLSVDEGVGTTRVYPQWFGAETTLPLIVYKLLSTAPRRTLGTTSAGSELETYEVQVLASSNAGAASVAGAVRTALEQAPATTVAGETVSAWRLQGQGYDITPPADAGEAPVYRVIQTYSLDLRR